MEYNISEAIEFINENDVKFIRLAFCDVFGKPKNISIMPSELDKAFSKGIAIDSSSIKGFEMKDKTDLFLVPDPKTLSFLPWRPSQGRVARFFCDVKYADGNSFIMDPRSLLKKAISEASDLKINIGAESEFYLFKTDLEGNPTNIPLDKASYLDMAPDDKGENVRREICLTLEEMQIKPKHSHHEHGPGQNKIDFKESDVLSSADNVMTFRTVVKTIAARNGLVASFQPKPIKNAEGNGFHIFITLNQKSKLNAFMAGIMEHINDITLFLNPSLESYDRLGDIRAPKYISWSSKNITPLIRVPEENDETWIELRSPDSLANPYLAYALIIYAGLDGINQNLEPSKESKTKTNGEKTLPKTLEEAFNLANQSKWLNEIIPNELINKYKDFTL